MARNVLSPIAPSMAGSSVALTASTVDGDAVPRGTALLVNNTSGSPVNVTVVTGGTAGPSLAIDDIVVAVPAGTMRLIGPFIDSYLPQTDNTVWVNYSAFGATVTRVCLASGY